MPVGGQYPCLISWLLPSTRKPAARSVTSISSRDTGIAIYNQVELRIDNYYEHMHKAVDHCEITYIDPLSLSIEEHSFRLLALIEQVLKMKNVQIQYGPVAPACSNSTP